MKIATMAFLLSALLMSTASYAAEVDQVYTLYFPHINLDKKNIERILCHVSVSCGHIEAIERIPYDWYIEIVNATSGVEVFNASAGHGTAMLNDIKTMNGSIRLSGGTKDCLDIKTSIIAFSDGVAVGSGLAS